MLAVFVNCIAICVGSLTGVLFSRRIPQKVTDSVQTACGLVSFVTGVQMAFRYQNVVFLALALILGGITGTLLDIDGKILRAGEFLERFFARGGERTDKNFAFAFLNSSVLFCVGAMAIVGSFKAGIERDYSIIFLKSILDGSIAVGFAAAMGVGTAFSALSVLLYQGSLTLLSVLISPFVTERMIAELTGSGGSLIILIGINLMGIKKIKTANYLPSVIFSAVFVLCAETLGSAG